MPGPKVLIIEDDLDLTEAMRMILEANKYEVEIASSGAEGLRKVKKTKPDLIILDIMLETDTEGFHVAYKLKNPDPNSEYSEFRHVPILVVTAISEKTHLRFSPQKDQEFLPVEGYIEKPIIPKDFLERVNSLVGKR